MAGRCSVSSEASSLRAKGNALFRDEKFVDSLVQYTAAVELDRTNPILYSNRSAAFLKLGQHFYALQDAEMAIRLNPDWSKGFYRKGQVEESAEQYESACHSYERGLRVNPHDEGIKKALGEVRKKKKGAAKQRKWQLLKCVLFFGALSSIAMVMDMNFESGILNSPISRWVLLFLTIVFGIFQHITALFHDSRMKMLLAPPRDLLKEIQKAESTISPSMESRCESTTAYQGTDSSAVCGR